MDQTTGTLSSKRRIVAGAALALAWIVLLPSLRTHFLEIVDKSGKNIELISKTTLEERRVVTYGDRTRSGYGYLKEIIADIPDPDFFPVARYRDYMRSTYVLFPGQRTRIDDRILVGIGLANTDVTENLVAKAKLLSSKTAARTTTMRWSFMTLFDYDLLTAFQLSFQDFASETPQDLKLTLITSDKDPTVRATWRMENVVPEASVRYTLPEPLQAFSYTRGATPFILEIEIESKDLSAAPAEISAIEILGVKVDISDYSPIHREGNCFTAMKSSFLKEILEDGPLSWRMYLEKLKNA